MNFFLLPPFFPFFSLSKYQNIKMSFDLCFVSNLILILLICICFCFFFNIFLINFFFNFIPHNLVSLNFYIKFDPYSFDCYFSSFF
jgi:hypothetical protein